MSMGCLLLIYCLLHILILCRDVIIEKHYRGLVNRSICDYFWDEVTKASSPAEVPPVIITPKFYLIHIHRNGIYFLTTVQNEVAPLLVIDFLQRAYDVFQEYLSGVTEGRLKENFTTVYQVSFC
jgi:AP-3 complex subunit mu